MTFPLPQESDSCRREGGAHSVSQPAIRSYRSTRTLRIFAAAFALCFLAAAGAQAQFGSLAVGASSSQVITVTAASAGTVSTVKVLSAGAGGLDYTAGAGGSCSGAGLAPGGQCTQPVKFQPAYPGVRSGAVVLLDSGNNVLGTAFLNGTGTGGLGVLVPSAPQSAAAATPMPGIVLPTEGTAQSLAGDGRWQDANIGDGNQAAQAELFLPSAVAIDGYGNFYIADSNHERVRMVCAGTQAAIAGTSCSAAGIISTVAGATGAQLRGPSGVAIDGAGNLYIADTGNHVVRRLSAATGVMTTFAGNGTAGYTGDGGAATAAHLGAPFAVALDATGDLFIADNEENVIRAVCAVPGKLLGVTCAAAGDIVTVAGTGAAGATGDNGPATSADLNGPYSLVLDSAGNLFIADTQNNRVRGVCAAGSGTLFGTSCTSVGMIFTITGDGTGSFAGDGGLASAAEVNSPSGLTVDPAGDLYIADTQNNRIRKINASTGIIVTIAGNGSPNYGGDSGPALMAGMHGPYGIAFYNAGPGGATPLAHLGDLLIADFFDQRVRSVETGLAIVKFPNPIRQGYSSPAPTTDSDPTLVTVENDGNAALDLTTLTAATDTAIGAQAIANVTLCADGNSLTVGTQCSVEPIFAPAAAPPLTTPTEPETGNIDVNNDVVSGVTAANSPLVITIDGTASLVNPTQVTLTSTPNPSDYKQTVTFKATVAITSGSGKPTGNVDFFDGATKLDTTAITVSSTGVAQFTISTLKVGTHQITATYNGDSNDAASTSNTVTQVVNEGTTTTLTTSANPSPLGTQVTFTAKVTAPAGGGVALDGTVTFLDNGAALGPAVPLGAGGITTFATSSLTSGVHPITAVYSGDATNFIAGSTSKVLNEDVVAGSTVTLAPPTPNPSTYGTTVTLTATVTSGGTVAPAGVVDFFSDGKSIGTQAFTGTTGVATFTIRTIPVGTHTITASYGGDSNVGPGTSGPQSLTVNPTQTGTTVSASPNPGIAGRAITFSSTVSITQGSGNITGTVIFTANGKAVCQGNLGVGGKVACNGALAPGTYSLVASYSGDHNDTASVSNTLAYTVDQATTKVKLTSSANPALVLSPVVFTVAVSGNGGTPAGKVTFNIDGIARNPVSLDATGTATLTDSKLAVGNHTVTAGYDGDTDDAVSSSNSLNEVITAIPTVTDLGASTSGGATPQTILVATTLGVSGPRPTGTITFNDGSKVIGSATLDSSGVATLAPDLPPGNYTIVAKYGGDTIHKPSTSQPVKISGSAQGFSITVDPASLSLVSGQNGTVKVTVTASAGFSDTIGMGCLTLPAAVNCHFSSNTVMLTGGKSQTIQLTIDTNAPLSGGGTASIGSTNRGLSLAGICLPAGLLFGFVFWRFRKRHVGLFLGALVLFLASAFSISGCGGTFNQVTAAPGTYTIQVGGVGNNSNVQQYSNVTLTVTK